MSRYIALTIGPIHKTITNTRKTRELWGSSYMFSNYMKKVLIGLKKYPGFEILLPSIHLLEMEPKNGAGLYHDQIVLKINDDNLSIDDFKRILDNKLADLAEIISETINQDKNVVIRYLSQYFQFYCIEKEIDESQNIIFELTPLLNTIELLHNFPVRENKKYIEQFLIEINSSQFISQAFESPVHKAHPKLNVEKFGFDSTVEISTREFGFMNDNDSIRIYRDLLIGFLKEHGTLKNFQKRQKKIQSTDEKEFLLILSKQQTKVKFNDRETEFNKLFRTYHKYIAIVQADGDNIGKIIGQIGHDPKQLQEFSKNLIDFSAQASELIVEYGGSPVYAGGDDLLFFAPVSMVQARELNNRHIFDLIETLDKTFREKLFKFQHHKPSLSFGVSITYYAFPMGEALNLSRHLLFEVAKKINNKNAVAVTLQKHSGSRMVGIYRLSNPSYSYFKGMLNGIKKDDTNKGIDALKKEIELIKSVVYKLRDNEELIKLIANTESKIKNFFDNSFNESIHKQEKVKNYLYEVQKLIFSTYSEEADKSKAFLQLYAMLRTLSFIKGEEI